MKILYYKKISKATRMFYNPYHPDDDTPPEIVLRE